MNAPCTIYLMRHGRTPMDVMKRSDGWLDLPLSDVGRMGLIAAQQDLKLVPLSDIYAPPLRRTQETAHIIESGVLSHPNIRTAPKAMTWDLGVLAGTPKVESRPKVRRLIAHPNDKPMGGESYAAFRERFMGWFRTRVAACKAAGKPILIICSGSNLRLLGKVLLGDSKALSLDEGALIALHCSGSQWHHEILVGNPDASKYVS